MGLNLNRVWPSLCSRLLWCSRNFTVKYWGEWAANDLLSVDDVWSTFLRVVSWGVRKYSLCWAFFTSAVVVVLQVKSSLMVTPSPHINGQGLVICFLPPIVLLLLLLLLLRQLGNQGSMLYLMLWIKRIQGFLVIYFINSEGIYFDSKFTFIFCLFTTIYLKTSLCLSDNKAYYLLCNKNIQAPNHTTAHLHHFYYLVVNSPDNRN